MMSKHNWLSPLKIEQRPRRRVMWLKPVLKLHNSQDKLNAVKCELQQASSANEG
jgi:hypothetical protein